MALAAGAQAAPPAQLPPGDYALALAHAGVPREYLLHVPVGYNATKPTPLVLVFHGTFGNANNIAQKSGLSELADREGFLVVYPEAAGIQWNDGREDSASKPPVDDVGFVSALIDHLSGMVANVDPRRVYATGLSSGGMLSYRLGIELSDKIAAIAPVAGILDESVAGPPSSAVAVVAFHGTEDQTVDYDGRSGPVEGEGALNREIVGGPHPSVPETIGRWVGFNGCSQTPTIEALPDLNPADGTRVDRLDYAPCRGGADVVLYRIDGGGHAWPGDRGGLSGNGFTSNGTVSYDISASEVMWDFFERHPKL